MKKLFFLTLLLLTGQFASAQTIIEHPEFSTTTANYVKIIKIELQDTLTKIDFEVTYFPNWWIQVSSEKTYIQDSKGGEKLFVTRAEGIKLNEHHWTPESGVNLYTLYFPAIDKSVEKIDFMEESWKIYDINLTGQKETSFIPEEIQGNWLKTDGSNEWIYGIYKDIIVYKNTVWDQVLINKKGKAYELTLKKDSNQEKIFIKPKKKNVLIGSTPENMQLFSTSKTYKPDFVVDDNGIELPVFNIDTAIYKGFIKGYHPKMGTTGLVHVDDIIIHEQNSHLIQIEPDGSFFCKIPMIYPQPVYVRILKMSETVYLEPGKTTFQYIDLSEFADAYQNYYQQNKRERKSLFMGELARVNSDLQAMDTIYYFNQNEAQKRILDMSGEDYKDYCLNIMQKEQAALNQLIQKYPVSKKAVQIKTMQIPFRTYSNILSYNFTKEYAYRAKNNIPQNQREIPLEREKFEPEYYDFINSADLNNPVSLVSGSDYDLLINRIRFNESIKIINNIISKEYDVETYDSASGKNITIKVDSSFYEDPETNQLIYITGKELFDRIEAERMKKYFGLDNDFASELMYAQSECEMMRGIRKPFIEEEKEVIRNNISNTFIVDYLMLYSDNEARLIEEKRAANKLKTGYVINETPKTEEDKLFNTIIEKYRGKVVLVDFWATWCGPCRSGIERIKPLKEELKDEAIEFVYITNQTSPLDTWNMMIPDIKGEHYRVEKDEWNHLSSKFNISGVPHYVLVDKNGTVVENNLYFDNEVLKMVLKKYLN